MKTAVEWFYQRILSKDIKQVFEQAKAMEKEQIENAWDSAYYGDNCHEGEQYYNETYKNKNEEV